MVWLQGNIQGQHLAVVNLRHQVDWAADSSSWASSHFSANSPNYEVTLLGALIMKLRRSETSIDTCFEVVVVDWTGKETFLEI